MAENYKTWVGAGGTIIGFDSDFASPTPVKVIRLDNMETIFPLTTVADGFRFTPFPVPITLNKASDVDTIQIEFLDVSEELYVLTKSIF